MICLVHNTEIVYGPASWDREALEPLIVAGFDVLDGVLYRQGERVCDFPDAAPAGPVTLGDFRLLPVAVIEEATPTGKVQTGQTPIITDTAVELHPVWGDPPPAPPEPSLEEVKTSRCKEVDALRDAHLRAGYGFERDGASHRLQTRGEDDRLNWLGVLNGCQALVMAGQGSTAVRIRTEGNLSLDIPATELTAILLGALNHQSAIYAAAWDHKDAINAITEATGGREAVLARDIAIGWPGEAI